MNIGEFAKNNQHKAAAELLQSDLSTVLKNLSDVLTYLCLTEQQKINKLLIDEAQISVKRLRIKTHLNNFNKALMKPE